MKRVVIESPFAGNVELNLRYLRLCMHECITNDEAPFASHALYTQPGVLDDDIPVQRELGIVAGFAWRDVADLTVVYTDLGITKGMQYGIDDANRKGRPVEYRQLKGWVPPPTEPKPYLKPLFDSLSNEWQSTKQLMNLCETSNWKIARGYTELLSRLNKLKAYGFVECQRAKGEWGGRTKEWRRP